MRAEEFGPMVPVCTGALRVGGRERVAGEIIPEALGWSNAIRQLHIRTGNLAFVTADQAEQMSAVADKTKATAFRKQLEIAARKLLHTAKVLGDRLTQIDFQRDELQRKCTEATEKARKAEGLLADFDEGKPVDVEQTIDEPPTRPPPSSEEIKAAAEAETKAAAQRRKDEVIASLPRHVQTRIEVYYSELSLKELQAEALAMGLKTGSLRKAEVLKMVIEQAETNERTRQTAAEADKALAEGGELLDGHDDALEPDGEPGDDDGELGADEDEESETAEESENATSDESASDSD